MSRKAHWWHGMACLVLVAFLASAAHGATMTAYYDFEGTGEDPYDDPAGAFADNLQGRYNPAFSSDVPTNAAGSTQSASFNGDSALFTDAYTTDLGPDRDAWTIMFWVKGSDANQENNNTRLLSARRKPDGSGSDNPSWQVEGFGNNGSNGDNMDVRFNTTFPSGNGANWFNPDAKNALANTGETEVWHHVAFIASNSGNRNDPNNEFAQTFVDGVEVGYTNMDYYTRNISDDWAGQNIGNANGQLIIGGDAENAGSRAFSGLVDDLALFAGVVDSADILAIAEGRMSPADFLPQDQGEIPEPATMALLGLAACGLGGYLRKRPKGAFLSGSGMN